MSLSLESERHQPVPTVWPIISEISRKNEGPDEASGQTIFEDPAEITQLVAGDTVEMDLQT